MNTCTVCRRLIPAGKGSRCAEHPYKNNRGGLTAHQRGYGADYRRNRALVLEDGPVCALCRRRPATTADHILPVSRGGTNDLANLRPACATCNYGRGNRMPEGPRPDPYKPTIR